MGYSKPIETANAIYVISYEDHNFRDRSVYGKYNPDGICVESSMNLLDMLDGLGRNIKNRENISNDPIAGHQDVKGELDRYARKEIILVDPSMSPEFLDRLMKKNRLSNTILKAGGAYSGVRLLFRLIRSKGESREAWRKRLAKGSRRDLLFFLSAFGVSQAVYPSVLDDLVTALGKSNTAPGETERNLLRKLREAINRYGNPVLVEARNAITAEKLESVVAPQMKNELGRKPLIVIQYGGRHSDIEDLLLDSQSRQRIIQKLDLDKRKDLIIDQINKVIRLKWDSKLQKFNVKVSRAPIVVSGVTPRNVRVASASYIRGEKAGSLSRRAFLGSFLPKSRSTRRRSH